MYYMQELDAATNTWFRSKDDEGTERRFEQAIDALEYRDKWLARTDDGVRRGMRVVDCYGNVIDYKERTY